MAVDFLIASGKVMHLLAQSEDGVIASTPAEATNFPATHLHDGLPSVPFRHTSIAANNSNDADLNLAVNGDFENWDGTSPDVPTGWTLEGSTTVVKETADPIAGSASVRVDGVIHRDFEIPSGALVAFRATMAEFGVTTANAKIQIIDMETGEWIASTGIWQSAGVALFVESNEYSAAGDERIKGLVFTARPYSTVLEDVTTLRIRLICGGENDGDEAIFDDISLVVVPNFMSIHGHNVPNKHDPQLKSSGNSTFASDSKLLARMTADSFTGIDSRVIGTRRQPSFYYRLQDNCPVLDGSADAFELASPAAMSDSGVFTVSFFVRNNGKDAVAGRILALWDNGNSRLVVDVFLTSTNSVRIIAKNSSGTTVVDHTATAELLPPDTIWHHVLISIQLGAASLAKRSQIRVNGADVGTAATATQNETVDLSAVTKIAVGGAIAADVVSPDLQASINELYFQPAYGEDIDTQANREKFRLDSTGDRVSLASDGSTPSGGQAYIYLRGTMTNPVSDFGSNFGSAGAFATLGAPGSEVMFASQRYWRLAVNALATAPADLPTSVIELCQWVLTRTETLLQTHKLPYRSPRSRPLIEGRSRSGDIFRAAMSYADVQRYTFAFGNSLAAHDLWLELRDRVGGGTRAVVIVPDTSKAEVHFGFLSVNYPEQRRHEEFFQVRIDFEEMPFVESLVTS